MDEYVPWMMLAGLGAFHGLNPGMGWLFAVAVVVLLMGVAYLWVDAESLRALGAVALVLFGAYKILAPLSHPRWVGMRVGGRDLAIWSFLMATVHGAGLMLAPVLFRLPPGPTAHAAHAQHAARVEQVATAGSAAGLPTAELAAVGVHTAAMFLVMALVAVVVFEQVGLAILRRAWFNLDRLWAGALIGAGGLTLLV